MTSRIFFAIFLALCAATCTSVKESQDSPQGPDIAQKESVQPSPQTWQWAYSGPQGPSHWSSLNSEYSMCQAGQRQSPVNLVWSPPQKSHRVQFSYHPMDVIISNTGYTFRLEFTPQSSLRYQGEEYILEKAELRSPSEHTLSGRSMPLEIQFYHRSANGLKQVILSMFVVQGKTRSPWFDEFWQISKGTKLFQSSDSYRLNPQILIPPKKTFYHYYGSLTHPPCLENVEWLVFNTPLALSKDQIRAFRSVYHNNNRPIQPLHGRKTENF